MQKKLQDVNVTEQYLFKTNRYRALRLDINTAVFSAPSQPNFVYCDVSLNAACLAETGIQMLIDLCLLHFHLTDGTADHHHKRKGSGRR